MDSVESGAIDLLIVDVFKVIVNYRVVHAVSNATEGTALRERMDIIQKTMRKVQMKGTSLPQTMYEAFRQGLDMEFPS